MFTILVTGASRGIGFGIVSLLAQRDDVALVLASSRSPNSAHQLNDLIKRSGGKVKGLQLDTEDERSVAAAAQGLRTLAPDGINVLINNAGIFPTPTSILDPGFDSSLVLSIQSNLFATLSVVRVLLPSLASFPSTANNLVNGIQSLPTARLPFILNISSIAGSTAAQHSLSAAFRVLDNTLPPANPAYGISKATLNMAGVLLARELEGKAVVGSVHPGRVRSDMGGKEADLSVEQSAHGIISNIDFFATPESSGGFIDWKDETVPF